MSGPPTVDEIRDRWVDGDRWGELCGESRIRSNQHHEALEGLRHARQDIRRLLEILGATA